MKRKSSLGLCFWFRSHPADIQYIQVFIFHISLHFVIWYHHNRVKHYEWQLRPACSWHSMKNLKLLLHFLVATTQTLAANYFSSDTSAYTQGSWHQIIASGSFGSSESWDCSVCSTSTQGSHTVHLSYIQLLLTHTFSFRISYRKSVCMKGNVPIIQIVLNTGKVSVDLHCGEGVEIIGGVE